MRNAPWSVIEASALKLTRSLEIVTLSLDGLMERFLRDEPNSRGLAKFWAVSQDITENTRDITRAALEEAFVELAGDRERREPLNSGQTPDPRDTIPEVVEAFESFVNQMRTSYARQMRNILTARAWGQIAGSQDTRIMTRNGRRIDFSDWALLTSRKALIDLHNLAKIHDLIEAGATQFQVVHREVGHSDDGRIFEIQQYPEIQATVFHPRSGALVGET